MIGTNHPSCCKDRPEGDAYGELTELLWKGIFFSRTHRFGFTQEFLNVIELLSCSGQVKNLIFKPKKKKIHFDILLVLRGSF